MGEIRSFRDLIVWKKGIELVGSVYASTKRFPRDELFGVTSQMRRAVVSVPSNIAEGHNQRHRRVFSNHLDMALGSLAELDTLCEVSVGLGYLSTGFHKSL